MANNPYVNKVELANGTTLIDLSTDTAVASDVAQGKYFHLATGERVQGTGGGATPQPSPISSGVKFLDYDGTELYNYNTTEALALTALPTNPSHSGLTAQGWNWTLADIKSYLTSYPDAIVNVGQMYTTDDGKTRVYIHLSEERKSPILGVCPNGTVDVDWGDGTTHSTLTGTSVTTVKWTSAHNYAHGGDYVIKLTVTGTMGLYGYGATNQYTALLRHSSSGDGRNRYYCCAIKKVELGNGVTTITDYALRGSFGLNTLTMPSSVTSIGNYALGYCYSLGYVTIPTDLTSISTGVFNKCQSLRHISIPSGITSIGTYAFQDCVILDNLTTPKEITAINDYALNDCHAFTRFDIPDGVTKINQYAFVNCLELTSITIPSSVTSIGAYAFQNCLGMREYHIRRSTPPTLSNSNAFTGIATDCVIYVPSASLATYKAATNWKTYASYMQGE